MRRPDERHAGAVDHGVGHAAQGEEYVLLLAQTVGSRRNGNCARAFGQFRLDQRAQVNGRFRGVGQLIRGACRSRRTIRAAEKSRGIAVRRVFGIIGCLLMGEAERPEGYLITGPCKAWTVAGRGALGSNAGFGPGTSASVAMSWAESNSFNSPASPGFD
jgi:hypothetical protein